MPTSHAPGAVRFPMLNPTTDIREHTMKLERETAWDAFLSARWAANAPICDHDQRRPETTCSVCGSATELGPSRLRERVGA